jgi:hypothetical protein
MGGMDLAALTLAARDTVMPGVHNNPRMVDDPGNREGRAAPGTAAAERPPLWFRVLGW